MILQTGPVRLALLNPDGSKQKTLILPAPEKGSPGLEWIKKASTKEVVDGGERTRLLGFLPQLTLSWSVYDDTQATGTGNGQTPTLEALLVLLSQATGTLRVSPGLSAGGFTADQVDVKEIGKVPGFYTGIKVTFRARLARPARDLEVF